MRACIVGLFAAVSASIAPPALGQETRSIVSTLEDIVVVTRRSGAPVWHARSADATVIVVGSVSEVPADTPWRPEALESATAQADTIILSQSATMSLGDYFRLRRARAHLPEGATTADYLTPEWQARLTQRARVYRRDYAERGLTWIADDLLGRLRYREGRSATEIVRNAARKAGVRVVDVGALDGRHTSEAVAVPDAAQVACLTSAIQASEVGVEGVLARGLAWSRQDVPAVLDSPMTQSEDRCGWFADETLIQEGRAQWTAAVRDALTRTGTTMVVAPISVVAEPGGLLDQIETRGLTVLGPVWRAAEPNQTHRP